MEALQSFPMSSAPQNGNVRLHASQGMKFITCGLIGAAMEFSIIKLLVGTYHVTPYVAYVPSALIPATFVFFFNKFVTFRALGHTSGQTRRFLMVYLVAIVANYILSSVFYTFGHALFIGHLEFGILINEQRLAYVAKAMAIGVTAVFNYSLSHFFIFRKDPEVALAEASVF